MNGIRPTGVTADRGKRELVIGWNDGRECRYPFAGLRAICPCVTCKGGHANMGGPPDVERLHSSVNPELNLEAVHPVGSYALQFVWSDGHDTGIYTWDYLRQACG
ncbi:MAG: DUF971 domain-containing protein [Anaerolineales bacterium]|nr:DUF971 domain-containing protein [Anaerolineales bacterium]